MKNKEHLRTRDPLKYVISTLEKLNEKGTINTLSIQSSGVNDPIDYTQVSFKIPDKY